MQFENKGKWQNQINEALSALNDYRRLHSDLQLLIKAIEKSSIGLDKKKLAKEINDVLFAIEALNEGQEF